MPAFMVVILRFTNPLCQLIPQLIIHLQPEAMSKERVRITRTRQYRLEGVFLRRMRQIARDAVDEGVLLPAAIIVEPHERRARDAVSRLKPLILAMSVR